MRSAFNGIIEDFLGIFVDNFSSPSVNKPRAYFLSHTHKDHTSGLHDAELLSYLEDTGVRIYMSELSASFVTYSNNSLKKYISILKLGSELVTLPETDNHIELLVNVKVIPAGHSCGSIMIMFEVPHKRVLYTGDFRIDPNDLPSISYFHDSKNDIITINTLYVDTTFISQDYNNFPKRSETVNIAVSEIASWLERDGNNRIALNTSASTGYEYVFNEIHEKLGLKIHVDSDRWRFYREILHLVPAMTHDPQAKIHLCHYTNRDSSHTKCLGPHMNTYNFLKLRFSAQPWRHFSHDEMGIEKVSENHINVCFATHCSLSELKAFVNYLAPKKIVGFPNEYTQNGDVNRTRLKRRNAFENGVCKKVSSTELRKILQF